MHSDRAAARAGELLDHPPRHARGQQRATCRDHSDRAEQLDRLGVLEDEAAAPRGKCLEHVLVDLERDQHDDSYVRERLVGSDLAQRREPVEHRHADVHEHHVGHGRSDQVDAGRSVGRVAYQLGVGLSPEQRPEVHADQDLSSTTTTRIIAPPPSR